MIINVKFLLHWLFCMSFTLADRYKTFHSLFMVLGVALCKKSQAEKMLQEANLKSDMFEKGDSIYTVPKEHKTQLKPGAKSKGKQSAFKKSKTKSSAFRKTKKTRKNLRFEREKFNGKNSPVQKKISSKANKPSKFFDKAKREEISLHGTGKRTQHMDSNPRNTTNLEDMATQQKIQKMKLDKNEIERLVILEDEKSWPEEHFGFSQHKNILKEPIIEKSEGDIEVFQIAEVKKQRKQEIKNRKKPSTKKNILDGIDEDSDYFDILKDQSYKSEAHKQDE